MGLYRCVEVWFDITVRNGLMGKLLMKLKIRINYSKSLKNQNYTLIRISIIQQDINYKKMIFNKKRALFQNKLFESTGKPKDLWKALKSLGLSYKVSSCEVKALKINNTV